MRRSNKLHWEEYHEVGRGWIWTPANQLVADFSRVVLICQWYWYINLHQCTHILNVRLHIRFHEQVIQGREDFVDEWANEERNATRLGAMVKT